MKKYLNIYNYYKELITAKQMKSGDRLPSVRQAAEMFSVSKTTIQSAYFELQADGFIISQPQSGYFVSDISPVKEYGEDDIIENNNIIYDLSSGGADRDSFDLRHWQRYVKSALRQEDRFFTYSDVQGEADLRAALSDYIREKRNVTASPDRIVVGAGVQSLLYILCSLIEEKKTVSFPDSSFKSGARLFSDFGFDVKTRHKDADIIYVSPSHMTSYGDVMPIKRRVELVRYSRKNKSLVIEDDFDSDFIYNSKPTPSLFALAGGGNVVYMGSFSNVLIPGIRISFMVLTAELAKRFKENKACFAQTASKTEQIALCNYIRDNNIKAQTRKIKRLYLAKTKSFYEEIKRQLDFINCEISDNGLCIKLTARFEKDEEIFIKKGISVNIKSYENSIIKLVLVPTALRPDEIKNAVSALKEALN